MKQSYRITKRTLAILSIEDSPKQAKIIEMEREVYSASSPSKIIRENCLYYGSTYEGRRQAIQYHLHYKQKIPIAISPSRDLFLFPTESPRNKDCSWILFHGIKNIQAEENNLDTMTAIQLINGQSLFLNISSYTIQTQYDRTGLCKTVFEQL